MKSTRILNILLFVFFQFFFSTILSNIVACLLYLIPLSGRRVEYAPADVCFANTSSKSFISVFILLMRRQVITVKRSIYSRLTARFRFKLAHGACNIEKRNSNEF